MAPYKGTCLSIHNVLYSTGHSYRRVVHCVIVGGSNLERAVGKLNECETIAKERPERASFRADNNMLLLTDGRVMVHEFQSNHCIGYPALAIRAPQSYSSATGLNVEDRYVTLVCRGLKGRPSW